MLITLGAAESALDLIEEAERDWRSVGEIDAAIRSNLGRMHVLDELGRHTDAVVVGRSMLSQLLDRGDTDEIVWLRAAAEENTGVALGYLGCHAEALDAYASASICYEQLGMAADSARVLANRGVELNELARPTEAIEALERAHDQFNAVGDRLWQALCQTNLSQAWIAAGRYLEAFRCLDAAESSLAGLDQTTEWSRAQLARATCLESLHLDVEALDLYDDLIEPLTKAGLLDDLGTVHLGRGTILARGASPDEALDAFGAAFVAFESTGNDPMLARTCLAAGPIDTDPLGLIERAIDLLATGERPAELAIAHLAAAKHLESVDLSLASAALIDAAGLIEPLGVPSLRWQLHHRTGRLERRAGQNDEARRSFEAAIGVLETIRSSVDRDGIRQRFDGASGEAADDLIELLLDAGDADGAFAVSESVRGRGLVDRLRAGTSTTADAPPDELLSTYDRLLMARGPLVDELAAQARRLERRASVGADVTTSTRPELLELPPNTIAFQTIADEIVAFVTDGDNVVAVRKVAELSEVDTILGHLDAQWRRFAHHDVVARHATQLEMATVELLGRLHDVLIGPLRDHFSTVRPLTFVPDRSLGAVPFAALHDGERYLVERQAVRQTPSVVADEILSARHRSLVSLLALGTADRVAPLASIEAEQVGEAWSLATVHVGSAAVADTLFASANDHDIIHIAGHGLFRPDAPEFSAIRLADRWVTAAEIARLRLDGQLVILSACDTGRRTLNLNMREMLGLPRAFLAAGAGGVLVNQWAADDRATVELMTALHRSLASGDTVPDALRSAQLDTMTRHRHPYFWGATTLIGWNDGARASADDTTEGLLT